MKTIIQYNDAQLIGVISMIKRFNPHFADSSEEHIRNIVLSCLDAFKRRSTTRDESDTLYTGTAGFIAVAVDEDVVAEEAVYVYVEFYFSGALYAKTEMGFGYNDGVFVSYSI